MYSKIWLFLCVLVLCTQVNMMFVMLLWVCKLKSLPDHGGNRTHDLWSHFPQTFLTNPSKLRIYLWLCKIPTVITETFDSVKQLLYYWHINRLKSYIVNPRLIYFSFVKFFFIYTRIEGFVFGIFKSVRDKRHAWNKPNCQNFIVRWQTSARIFTTAVNPFAWIFFAQHNLTHVYLCSLRKF
jgi:hypothetical protein